MKVLLALAFFAFLATGGLTQDPPPDEESKRVVNGNNADQHEWPWQISLLSNGRHICGGSLIRKNMVLTAAHCVYYSTSNPERYKVVVGAHNRKTSTAVQKTYGVTKIYEHQSFRMRKLRKDIAILVLDKDVTLSKHVKLIDLPKQGDRVPVGTECFITGWGRTKGGGKTAIILQEAPLRVADHKKCDAKFGSFKMHEESMLCAGGEGKGGCQGDSGGPLSCQEGGKWILRGVVSFGHRYCNTGFYTVFARVSSFIDWINNQGSKGSRSCIDKDNRCPGWKRYCHTTSTTSLCRKTCNLCN